jgi:hypothetical protein
MIQYKTFKTSKDFLLFQLEGNPNIHSISPIAISGKIDFTSDVPQLHVNQPMDMDYEHGVMVVYSENKSLSKLNVVSMVQAMQQAYDGWVKSNDVATPMKMMKIVLDNYKKQHNLDEIGREPEDQK